MKLKFLLIGFFFFFFFFLFPSKINAWSSVIHDYLCQADLEVSCTIADDRFFQRDYPFGGVAHLCLDNKPDCPPRLVAKYYVKKYFISPDKDPKLLAAAAHLLQDSVCPDHWFPMREFAGRIIVPFAPKWVTKTEGMVGEAVSRHLTSWDYPIEYHGQMIHLNQAYLDNEKVKIEAFLKQQPQESLEELARQIKIKNFWAQVRSLREIIYIVLIILLLILPFVLWSWLKTKKSKGDLTAMIFLFGLFIFILVLGFLFY
ncbi:hypothetical protein MUP35_02880 [Patescibacteria group bacterium]|nr:hypothetical protein [Patescibacteria group bacterium]